MKTITEMQTQIREMSLKLDEFARELSDYNQSDKQDVTINYKQIKAIGIRNPINGHILEGEDVSVKKKYITMLIALVYMAKEKQENAWLLIQRIAAGANFTEELIDLSVDAVNITDAQIDEFTLNIANANLTNAFILDAMLIYLSFENANDRMLEFLSALFELVKCGKKEVQELAELSKIIAEQNSDEYSKFILKDHTIDLSEYNCYINKFHYGVQYINSKTCLYIGNGKNEITEHEFDLIKSSNVQNIIIEKAVFCLNKELEFKSRLSVLINECSFIKSEFPIWFISCSNVELNNCTFTDISNKIAYLKATSSFIVNNSHFANCGFVCDGDKAGGIFEILDNMEKIELVNTRFSLCYIKARTHRYNYGVSGCLINGSYYTVGFLHVENVVVSGCECINNGNYTESLFYNLNFSEKLIENNNVSGKVQRWFN